MFAPQLKIDTVSHKKILQILKIVGLFLTPPNNKK